MKNLEIEQVDKLKIKAFDIRHQIDKLEQQKQLLIQKYNKLIIEIKNELEEINKTGGE